MPNPLTKDEQYREALRDFLLQHVSRTFALVIPLLPEELRPVVGNAYLLCRVTDTIEDDPALPLSEKTRLFGKFMSVLRGAVPPDDFSDDLYPKLASGTPEGEKGLIRNLDAVIRDTFRFSPEDQENLLECVAIMSRGMRHFQELAGRKCLSALRDLNDYCYYVAGVVGEMLTRLFCAHSGAIRARKTKLEACSVSFGQGLQMVNILKDVWKDLKNDGVCWLPEEIFRKHGYDLSKLAQESLDARYEAGILELTGIGAWHLDRGLEYVKAIPVKEKKIRQACLWTLSLSYLTLRRIVKNLRFTDGSQVKISRASVKRAYVLCAVASKSNFLLGFLFGFMRRGLPAVNAPDCTVNKGLGNEAVQA
jgi:farnesyl-diphosphate farnesyltransferase